MSQKKRIIRRRWIGPDWYVEVRVERNWNNGGMDKVDVYVFTRDPRKAQARKPRFWSRTSSHGFGWTVNFGTQHKATTAANALLRQIRLTSSVGRALAS